MSHFFLAKTLKKIIAERLRATRVNNKMLEFLGSFKMSSPKVETKFSLMSSSLLP
jgi:hypothetical protein